MIYKQNSSEIDDIMSVNENAFTESNFGKILMKILRVIKDALAEAWKTIKKIFTLKIPEDTVKSKDGDQPTGTVVNDPNTQTATDTTRQVFMEPKRTIRIGFGELYNNPENFIELAVSFNECVNSMTDFMNRDSFQKDEIIKTINNMTTKISQEIGSGVNPKTWKQAMNEYCGDTRKDELVYVSDVINMPCFTVCKDESTYIAVKDSIDKCIKLIDKSCDKLMARIKQDPKHTPPKCNSGFQPKFWNDTRDYDDVKIENIGHILYDVIVGLNDITQVLCISLKTYARSTHFIYEKYKYIKKCMESGTVVKENAGYDIFSSFIK